MNKDTIMKRISKKDASLTTQMPHYLREALDLYVRETGRSSSGSANVEILLAFGRTDPLFGPLIEQQKQAAIDKLESEAAAESDKLGEVLQAADKVLALAPKPNAKPKKPEGDKILVQF